MNEIDVIRGCSPRDPEKHCNDGDSTYLSGKFEDVLFRLRGLDAFEINGMSIEKLMDSRFLYRLTKPLRYYLWPKLTEESVEIHKRLGYQAREYFESILVEELKASFRNEVLDRYGRALVNLWCREGLNSYNLTLVTA